MQKISCCKAPTPTGLSESKLVFSRKPSGYSQNGGLIAYQDDDNYIKLVYGAGGMGFGRPGGNQSGSLFLASEENGNSKNIATISMTDCMEDNTLILKLEKKGDRYSASILSQWNKIRISWKYQ